MIKTKTLVAVLTMSTALTSGAAFAQSPTSPPPRHAQQTARQQTAEKDFTRLSKDGSRAFQDLALARLAIFDGRTDDAKTYVGAADTSFGKAKTDDTVFTKAEADLKSPQGADASASGTSAIKGAASGQSAVAAQNNAGSSSASNTQAANSGNAPTADMKTPVAWLPVDGEISITDDFSANPTKAAAVADANKSLAKGDRQGALDKLKLADVDLGIVLAVVPVNQTVTDVHQAAQLVDSGKYYEASQLLRKVQDSARFDVAEIVGTPKSGAATSNAQSNPAPAPSGAATH